MNTIVSRTLASAPTLAAAAAAPFRTEDTGKMFEMAICLAYGIPYDGKYPYSLELPNALKPRLSKLTELFPMCYHTAKRGSRYDYTATTDESLHLSAKSTKGGGKVAPQVIGQCQPQKFCTTLGIPYKDIPTLKQYIQTNPTTILPHLVSYTFDCPTVFYNQAADTIQYITLVRPIDWTAYTYNWTCPWDRWGNSSTLKLVTSTGAHVPLVEFQFHTKSRTNMAIRWSYENFLTLFKDHLSVVSL